MDARLKSLLWKEWRERRRIAAFGAVMLGGYTAVALRTRLLGDEELLMMRVMLSGFVIPMLLTMGLVASERAEGSFATLLALPERPGRLFAARLAAAALAHLAAVALPALVAVAMAGGRELSTARIATLCLREWFFGLQVLLWMLLFAIGQPSEARAGLVGAATTGLLVLWAMAIDGGAHPWYHALNPLDQPRFLSGSNRGFVLAVQIAALPVLAGVVGWRFSRVARKCS